MREEDAGLSALQFVALAVKKRVYLKITPNGYYSTTNASEAYRDTQDQVVRRLAVLRNAGVQVDDFMVMKSKDAARIAPGQCKPHVVPLLECSTQPNRPITFDVKAERPISRSVRPTPMSDTALDLVDAVNTLYRLTSKEHVDELSRALSEADKRLSDTYHFIEVSNLNAAQGYQAYKELQRVLIERRKVKNEITVVQRVRQMGIASAQTNIDFAQRAWDPARDILSQEEEHAELS